MKWCPKWCPHSTRGYKELHGAVKTYIVYRSISWLFFLLRRFRSIWPRFLGPGLFQRGVDGGVVGFQHFLFPFQTHIDVPGGNSFKVHGEAQRRADTGEGVAQHFTDRIEVPGQLVHVRGRRVPQIVVTDMRHVQPGQ